MSKTVDEIRNETIERFSKPEVISINYHRNGVGGDGFYVGLIRNPWKGTGEGMDPVKRCPFLQENQQMFVAIIPSWAVDYGNHAPTACPSGGYPCYVIDPNVAAGEWPNPGSIDFGINSWRGDNYFDLMLAAARKHRGEI